MKILKKISLIFITIFICVGLGRKQLAHATNNEDESHNFNFIKSDESIMEFIYDGSVLLYGGIALVCISGIGMFFVCRPQKNKLSKHKTDISRHD